jgi:hypothetical protein
VIVVSLLLVAVAAVLLVLGLWQPSNALLSGSIGASVVAAVLLVVGARRSTPEHLREFPDGVAAGGGAGEEAMTVTGSGPRTDQSAAVPAGAAAAGAAAGGAGRTIPHQGTGGGAAGSDETAVLAADPPDEPPVQPVSPADAERVSRMNTEVLVVDGRPRYHLPGCVHLLGRDSEPLPVSEAIELGFTPCGLCEPDSALLAEARRV